MASQRFHWASQVIIGIFCLVSLSGRQFRGAPPIPAVPPGSPPTLALPSAVVRVSNVTIDTSQTGKTLVDVMTSDPAPYKVLQLAKPTRLVVDLEGAQNATQHRVYAKPCALLKRVRIGQFHTKNPAVVRIVAELNGDPAFDVHSTLSGVRIELRSRELALPPVSTAEGNKITPTASMAPSGQTATPSPPPTQAPPPAQAPIPPSSPVPGASLQGGQGVFYLRSPFHSPPQNERLLDSLGLRIMLNLGYRKGEPNDAAWKTKGVPGVEASRLFIKPVGPGAYRTIELALAPSPQGGYELAIFGQQIDQTALNPNPDVSAAQQIVAGEVARMEQAPPPADARNLAYETYYLSYVVADRAIALLKTLGYTTVEYNGQAGESVYQTIYNPIKLGTGKPPIIVKLLDSTKTSLMESPSSTLPNQAAMPQAMPLQPGAVGVGGPTFSSVPAIGGTYLHQMTSGEPQERLLILYEKNDPESLQSLVNLLQSTIDLPSRQIMIEALVIEMNSNRSRDLGVTFETQQNKVGILSTDVDPTTGAALPFVFSFDKDAPKIATFKAQLQALLQTGEAEILSNPSVLVLDDRQARIQIGQQVPVVKSVSTQAGIISSVDYFPVGIVLNLRPRVSDDGAEITMQAETIVSAVNRLASAQVAGVTSAFLAPVVDNRQVQSIVRVADNTPFIIGGLISTNNQTQVSGIPLLSQIPALGALFRRQTVSKVKQEVIIVVTPHVVPAEDKYFSYLIPKDSDQFDRFRYDLFRNAYRIRGRDLFDLEFVYGSNVYKQLVSRVKAASTSDPELKTSQAFATVLNGGAPGEDILVRRMLWEIINTTHYARYVNPDKIIFFESTPTGAGGSGFKLAFIKDKMKDLKHGGNALALKFEAQPRGNVERPFVPPKGVVSYSNVTAETYPEVLINDNSRNPDGSPRQWSILISKTYSGIKADNSVTPLELLQGVLVLKRLLELNISMPLTLKEFHIGRQIVFPSQDELKQGNHFIDREVAKLFYEVYNYYPAFEQQFNLETSQMNAQLDKLNR